MDIFGAVTLEDETLVRELVQRNASVLAERMRSFQNVTITPLHLAAFARLLLERGADLSLRDLTYGGTPAHWAKEYRRREMCAFLEAQGGQQSLR
jgi:Ankyrin repeat